MRDDKAFSFIIALFIFLALRSQAEIDLDFMTFNIWQEGTSVSNGLTKIRDVIFETNPDVLGFTEVRNYGGQDWTSKIVDELSSIGLEYYGGYAGGDVSVISKFPIQGSSLIYNGEGSVASFNIVVNSKTIIVACGHLDYTYYACYLPRGYNGGSPNWNMIDDGTGYPKPVTDIDQILAYNLLSSKDEQLNTFLNYAQDKADPAILMGDFNDPSHLDWTINTSTLFDHNGLVIPWQNTMLLADSGYTDSYREFFPNEVDNPGITWPSYAHGKGSTSWTPLADERDRIDYIFYKGNDITTKYAALVGPRESYENNKLSTTFTENENFIADTLAWPSDHKAVFATLTFQNISKVNEISTLQSRLFDDYAEGSASGAENYLSSQKGDGSWSNIDYSDRGRASWAPAEHLNRLRRMAVAFCTEDNSSAMLQGISKGLEFWYTRKPESDNWWWNDIGQQARLGPTLILMEEDLSNALVDAGCIYLNDPSQTGLNLVDFATQTIHRGCLQESLADINMGLNAIKNEIRITTNEGIQPDYSFHQHGPQLYNYGYGSGYASSVSYWINKTRGLSFAFKDEKMNIFVDYILDGDQWMTRRGYMDQACRGRNVSRKNSGSSSYLFKILEDISGQGHDREQEIRDFLSHIKGKYDGALTGNKHFWRSDYQAHRRENYHTSVKMVSKRTTGTEMMNSENLKGYYLPFGATMIMCSGEEYHNLYPVMDWARIPGVTSPYKNPVPAISSTYIKGTTSFVGGASNGLYGVAGFDLKWDRVTGRKSWFYFDNEFVALGAGITGSGSSPIYTSINQCRMNGTTWAGFDTDGGSIISKGKRSLNSPKWVFHDKVGYVFPNAGNVDLKNESQSGSWNSINKMYALETISQDVFSLWINHGERPANASYEYIVVPGTDKATVQAYAQDIPVRTIVNDIDIQAVSHDGIGIAGIVFYKEGKIELKPGMTVKVNQPCIVVVDESQSEPKVTLSNPASKTLTVNVNFIYANKEDVHMHITLPDGGKSVTARIQTNTEVTEPKFSALPKSVILDQNYPNPFNPTTRIRYELNIHEMVKLRILNMSGQEIRVLENEYRSPGIYEVMWNGKDNNNQQVAAGIYLCQLSTRDYSYIRKMVFVR